MLDKTYQPGEIENKWYQHWMEKGYFHSEPDEREAYTIVIPPPNVTGVLHMGHMLNNTIQDVMIRRARMLGKNACWVPGTDHASIATEAKVVKMLADQGIHKKDLSREEFLKHAWDWKEKYGGIILEQLKKLGCSCDWERTRFTMEDALSDSVIQVFVDLYQKGLIYRGVRMVNWDPQGKTALSDEEVIYKDVNSRLFHVRYKILDSEEHVIIATTRPETILADTAIAVHPEDPRYKHLHGKKALVPFINREIPIITDEYVTMEFGTGCLKVTPAHDLNDYELGLKHKLPVIDILNPDGSLNEKAQRYVGEDRFAVRKKIAKDLEEAGQIEKIEDYKNQVGYSERTDAVIEPRLSMQWFVNMKKYLEKNPQILDAVMNDEIQLHPAKFKNTYRHWIENIKDWCISRQLWWGQQIPAYYLPDGEFVVAENIEEALKIANASGKNYSASDLKQDEDVLDTWFSSWLWPISVFDGFTDPGNKDVKYYYPTNDLVTAPEILFFWVARMIMAGYEFAGQKPFSNVYLTGIVRDKLRRKMSKSLGNSPDPLDLIVKYGADGVRMGMLLSSPAGNDILFDESQVEQGRNFCNKIWNAYRLIDGWKEKVTATVSEEIRSSNKLSVEWMQKRFNQALPEIDEKFRDYRFSEALMNIYKLIWDDFCSWYLEMIKPGFEQPIDRETFQSTQEIFGKLLQVLHPFMPFITEELWHEMENAGSDIIISSWPAEFNISANAGQATEKASLAITEIRNFRNSKGIPMKDILEISVKTSSAGDRSYSISEYIIKKLANAELRMNESFEQSVKVMCGKDELSIKMNQAVDVEEERKKMMEEIEYLKGFLKSVDSKLSNEKFVSNAKPDVVEKEKQKKADAEIKIKALEEACFNLK